ncbi:MAG: condensation domain-containing protein, partial [Acidobacteria bacterium]|nr:condensation domain-containing protein [Acidobacteriota bacterium]
PQLFNQFAAQNPGMFDNLRVLLVGGDLVRPPFVNEIRQRNQQLKILHMYGPTENTTFSTFLPVETNYENSIPIGRPIANSSVYILDRQKNLKPLVAVWELHVGGAGVGLGYLNQPERTAEKFDQDLWDKKDDQDKKNKSFFRGLRGAVFSKRAPLIYKTGDLARWLPGGVLEFLGRVDFQVKVRGVRIEITEIENHLLKHPGIKNIFVIAGESEEGEKYLAAYWEPKELLAHDDIDFREYLLKQLPEYMIPSYFIKIEKFPLTSHGKIDRKALPEPKSAGNTGVYNAPRDEVEKGLAQIWSEVLGMPQERIGIDMNFNRLGGHSLKATIMAAKIHKVYNVKIPLGVVFTTPYIKDLAIYIKTARKDFFTDLEPVEKKEYYDVSPAQKRVYLAHHMENDNISYNIPMLERLVLDRADMAIGENHLDLICRQLIAQHESLRTSFIQIEGKPRQKINDHVDFHIEYYDITGPGYNQTNNPAIKDIIDRFVRPFDLSLPPLLRLAIIKEDQHQLILLMDFHHIISDEFSQKILVKDFLKLLFGGQLLPLRLQYKDYSEWQNKTLKNNKKPGEEYWLKRFSGEIPQLHLPTDYPRTENTGSAGNSLEFFVAGEQTQLLLQLAGQEGTTLYMLLVAIFSILLSKIANQDDILIGTSVLGRNHADLQSITGMFVNILVLRNYPVGEKNFLDYLQEVKKNTLDAFENQEYPFEELVERVLPVRDRTRNPLFDVLFDYHELGANDMDPDFKQPDRDEAQKNGTVYYGIKHRAAKFDITWSASLLRNRLNFSVEYRTSLFEKETIENFIFYYRRIITTVLENPRQKISEISLSSRQNQDLALLAQDLEII